MLSERLCDCACVFVVQRRASVVILTNGGYGDLFAMLGAAARDCAAELERRSDPLVSYS